MFNRKLLPVSSHSKKYNRFGGKYFLWDIVCFGIDGKPVEDGI